MSVYGVVNPIAKPMVDFWIPTFDSQYPIVPSNNISGKPLDIPINSETKGIGRK
ncbi:hypothetical protein M529_20830 [Sphingobium ummariense RL-3]|uniref:Uncharacterized protein n=1 Tax=Sphingobium ummariense RL-3 TaxID=1346791 RepID=T0IX16_9SPHN|nr:hypothetical protein M529_20830 [Sphingobium ummariense RL-3]